jgi:hypothetical protein
MGVMLAVCARGEKTVDSTGGEAVSKMGQIGAFGAKPPDVHRRRASARDGRGIVSRRSALLR